MHNLFLRKVTHKINRSIITKRLKSKKIFKEILTHTSGDVDEALDWLGEIDREYKITSEDYTMDDEDLKVKFQYTY